MVKQTQPGKTVKTVADGGTGLILMVQAQTSTGKVPSKTYYWRGRIGKQTPKIKIARVGTIKLT